MARQYDRESKKAIDRVPRQSSSPLPSSSHLNYAIPAKALGPGIIKPIQTMGGTVGILSPVTDWLWL